MWRCAPIPTTGCDRSRDRGRSPARELLPAGVAHARRFTWRAAGEAMLAGYEAAR